MPVRRKRATADAASPEVDLPIGTALAAHAERAAACELELIQLCLSQQKLDIARRRLQKLQDEFPGTTAATDANRLLKTL
jgi:hypothetical protein